MEGQERLEISQKHLNKIFQEYSRYKEESIYKSFQNDKLKKYIEDEVELHIKEFILRDRFVSEGYQKAKKYLLWHERIADDTLKRKLKEFFNMLEGDENCELLL